MKNYVLLDDAGELTIRGSGLKSRGLERFQRRFMEEMFRLLLRIGATEMQKLFDDYVAKHRGAMKSESRDLMKTETLQDSLDDYREKVGGKRRNARGGLRAGAQILAPLRRRRPDFLLRDRASAPGSRSRRGPAGLGEYDPNHPDENVEYYQAKLADLYDKFSILRRQSRTVRRRRESKRPPRNDLAAGNVWQLRTHRRRLGLSRARGLPAWAGVVQGLANDRVQAMRR